MYSCLARAQEADCNCTESKYRTVSGTCSETSDGKAMFFLRFTMVLQAEMGSRDGAVVRALASHCCGPSSIPGLYHMLVKFLVSSRLAFRVFLRIFLFSGYLHKIQHLQISIRP